MTTINSSRYIEHLRQLDPVRVNGKVTQVIGLMIESEGPDASIGDVCYIYVITSYSIHYTKLYDVLLASGEGGSGGKIASLTTAVQENRNNFV